MSTSELVRPQHLQRKALIYIRQSTPHQVLSNQESLRLQYALQQHALELGWRPEDIEIIDADLGLTATSASHRGGFQELVAKVTLGQVGIILSFDVMRLSRNCSDWYPLLDVCGYRGCLIADRDGIYDPGSANGRLLLGLKGQLSELELHTIRARMTAGLLNKAQRGELALKLPIGLVRDVIGKVHIDPNREIQYPAYISWETFEHIQDMLADNYAAYDRNKSRGVPRDGAALLHGMVYCGECGHKMVVQYKHGTRYLCNYLRQQYHVPVCQYIPADPVDVHVVEAFFQALSPVLSRPQRRRRSTGIAGSRSHELAGLEFRASDSVSSHWAAFAHGVATRIYQSAAQKGSLTCTDRQGGGPSPGTRSGPGAHCLERRRNNDALDPGSGRSPEGSCRSGDDGAHHSRTQRRWSPG